MANLLEQSISQNSRCFSCGSIVYAVEKKITTHHTYHNRCFRCRICKRNLTGFSLNEEGDDIYCTNCYRKKQRGDCNSLEFIRAAAEKAQYVHFRHEFDKRSSSTSTRGVTNRESFRNPSLTLRQLERQIHSYQIKPDIDQQRLNNSNSLNDCSLSKNETRTMPMLRSETIITPQLMQHEENSSKEDQNDSIVSPTGSATGAIEFRLHKSHFDLTLVNLSQNERKSSIEVPQLNEKSDEISNKFLFPNLNIKTIYRRSCSAHRLINPSPID